MRELQTGLWHWEAAHPDWKPGEEWDEMVSSYAVDDGDRLLLFDPLAPPSEIDELAAGRETAIVLTCPWHARDARSLAERLGAPLYVPPPDEGDPNPLEAQVFRAGDRLPVGVAAFPGMEPNDLVLWVESRRALVAGDTSSTAATALSSRPTGRTRACRLSRSSRRCARCSNCRSKPCSPRTGRPPTEPPSSARSPDARKGSNDEALGRRDADEANPSVTGCGRKAPAPSFPGWRSPPVIDVQRVDYIRVPVTDMEKANHFYGEVLGLERNPNSPGEDWVEYETGNVTLAVMTPHTHDSEFTALPPGTIALRVPDVAEAKAKLEVAGVQVNEMWDSGVCHGAGFHDPSGNAILLHHRYKPY